MNPFGWQRMLPYFSAMVILPTLACAQGRIVLDLNRYGEHPAQFVRVGEKMYYTMQDAESGFELWVREPDGSNHLVSELAPGLAESHVTQVASAGSRVVYAAVMGGLPVVWGSDGTEAGTEVVIPSEPGHWTAWIVSIEDRALVCMQSNPTGTPRGKLWVTDGTQAGTTLLTAAISDVPTPWVHRLGGNVVVFTARTDGSTHLWRSDGTINGTYTLGSYGLEFDHALTVQDGKALFTAGFGPVQQVHETDGTVAGTREVVPHFANQNRPADALRVGSKILLHAETPEYGRELHVYDPATNTLSLLADLAPGSDSSIFMPYAWVYSAYAGQFVATDHGVIFPAWTPATGTELFITDGTTEGTRVLRDIAPGLAWSDPRSLTQDGARVWFTANDGVHGDELWVTDGTAEGTNLAADLREGFDGSYPSNLKMVGEDLVFSASSRESGPSGWWHRGATGRIEEWNSRQSASVGSGPGYFLAVGRWLVFRAPEPDGISYSIWRSDGSGEGTLRMWGPVLYSNAFEDDDSEWIFAHQGQALSGTWCTFRLWLPNEGWRYWLANVETGQIRRFGPDPTSANEADLTVEVVGVRNGAAIFRERTLGYSDKYWMQSPEDATPHAMTSPSSHATDLSDLVLARDDLMVFRTRLRQGSTTLRLWFQRSTGTDLELVWEQRGLGAFEPYLLDLGNGRFLFEGPRDGLGSYLWVTDGTTAGTKVIGSDTPDAVPNVMTVVGGRAFFNSIDLRVHVSDGSEVGTHPLAMPNGAVSRRLFGSCNGLVVFEAYDAAHGTELWRTDGTPEGTFLLADITPGSESSRFQPQIEPAKGGQVLYLPVYHGSAVRGAELWRTDGTSTGTYVVPMSHEGLNGVDPDEIVVVGSKVFFTANTPQHGREPWVYEIPTSPSRFVNVSTRGTFSSDGPPMIAGIVLQGDGECNALLRGVGPTLASLGVSGFASAPSIRLMRGSSLVGSGTRLADATDRSLIRDLEGRLGAFNLPDDGRDGVLAARFTAGMWTMHADAGSGAAGTGLAELYVDGTSPYPVNISTRGPIDQSQGSMIVGFVIAGGERSTVLFRGVGPSLANLGVSDPAHDPRIDIFDRNGVLIGSNDSWEAAWNHAAILEAISQTGAFPLQPTSTDACALLELDPGAYTMHVRCSTGAGGTALGEAYLVPRR